MKIVNSLSFHRKCVGTLQIALARLRLFTYVTFFFTFFPTDSLTKERLFVVYK